MQPKSKQAKAAKTEQQRAQKKVSLEKLRDQLQKSRKPNDFLSQPQFMSPQKALSPERQCELEYAIAKIDPFGAKENPCSLGYGNLPSIVIKKQIRGVCNAGSGGLAFVCCNPYLALAENNASVAYTNAAYPSATNWGFANATFVNLTGGVFTTDDLLAGTEREGAVSGRVVGAAIRIKPIGKAVDTAGLMIGRQIGLNGQLLDGSTLYPTGVEVSEEYQDLTKPILNVTNDGEWTTLVWSPLTHLEGDLVPTRYHDAGMGARGASMWLGISGATKEYPFLFEVVVICEYLSLKKALGLARPSHQNAEIAAKVDTISASEPMSHGAPISTFQSVVNYFSELWHLNKHHIGSAIMQGIVNDGSWSRFAPRY